MPANENLLKKPLSVHRVNWNAPVSGWGGPKTRPRSASSV